MLILRSVHLPLLSRGLHLAVSSIYSHQRAGRGLPIRTHSCIGDFTKTLAKSLGCNFESSGEKKGVHDSAVVSIDKTAISADVDPRIRKVLPRVYIDGPFDSASEAVFKYEVAVLVGAGIGVTSFASILKSIWYRMNYPHQKTPLRKVYFFWVCRDFGSFEWFRSLLMAFEAQDMDNHIEILTVSPRSAQVQCLTDWSCISILPPRTKSTMLRIS